MENKEEIIKALKDLIYYGDGIKSSGSCMSEYPYYVKYLKSVKEFIKNKSSDKVVMSEMNKIPDVDQKDVPTASFSFFRDTGNESAGEYRIDQVNLIAEKLIFYLNFTE